MTDKIHVDRWRLNVPNEVEAVYDAAMAWYAACRDQEDYDVDQADEELDKLWEVCRRAKEGRGLDGKDDLPLVRALERAKELNMDKLADREWIAWVNQLGNRVADLERMCREKEER